MMATTILAHKKGRSEPVYLLQEKHFTVIVMMLPPTRCVCNKAALNLCKVFYPNRLFQSFFKFPPFIQAGAVLMTMRHCCSARGKVSPSVGRDFFRAADWQYCCWQIRAFCTREKIDLKEHEHAAWIGKLQLPLALFVPWEGFFEHQWGPPLLVEVYFLKKLFSQVFV